MASYDLPETIRELKWVERPSETHLSGSSTPGGSSALLRDGDNALVGQAVLFPAGDVIKVVAVAGIAVGIAVSVVAAKVMPRVRDRLNDLKPKLHRRSEDTVEVAAQEAGPEQPGPGVEEPQSETRRLYVA